MVVVKNTIPSCWNGRKYDVGIFRDGKLLMQSRLLHVGEQVNFLVKPLLYFAVVRNVKFEESVHIGEVSSYETMFDLSKFPTGLDVYLYKRAGGGLYYFKGNSKPTQ